jgi:drug/metabolite transporter (DMT)-like permease
MNGPMDRRQRSDLLLSLLSPVFLGMAPLFGKLAYQSGSDPFTVAALRTIIAAAILWVLYLVFWRKFIYIYPAGLLGCVVIGVVNGIGSLMFYTGLARLDASLAQLLNGTYLIFAVLLARLAGQPITARTRVRLGLTLVALILLTGLSATGVNWLGVGLMLGNAILFAGTILLSQRVLYEMPARTVTLYSLTTMAVVVTMARLTYGLYASDLGLSHTAFVAILLLGASTAAARLTMFVGVKRLGSLQTAIIAITEIGVTLLLAFAFLEERLTANQWLGVGCLAISFLLMRHKKGSQGSAPTGYPRSGLASLSVTHHMTFDQAFGAGDVEITPEELQAIRQMMGATADQPPPHRPGAGDRLPTAPDHDSPED